MQAWVLVASYLILFSTQLIISVVTKISAILFIDFEFHSRSPELRRMSLKKVSI